MKRRGVGRPLEVEDTSCLFNLQVIILYTVSASVIMILVNGDRINNQTFKLGSARGILIAQMGACRGGIVHLQIRSIIFREVRSPHAEWTAAPVDVLYSSQFFRATYRFTRIYSLTQLSTMPKRDSSEVAGCLERK